MKLKSIHIKNFKNIDELNWDINNNINAIIGINGIGKTNILSAINWFNKLMEVDFIKNNNIKDNILPEVSLTILLKIKKENIIDCFKEHLIENPIYWEDFVKFIISKKLNTTKIFNEIIASDEAVDEEGEYIVDFKLKNYDVFFDQEVIDGFLDIDYEELTEEERIKILLENNLVDRKYFLGYLDKVSNLIDFDLDFEIKITKNANFSDESRKTIEYIRPNNGELIDDETILSGVLKRFLKNFDKIEIVFENDFKKKILNNNDDLYDEESILWSFAEKLNINDGKTKEEISKLNQFEFKEFKENLSLELTKYLFSDWKTQNLEIDVDCTNKEELIFDINIYEKINGRKVNTFPEDLSSGHIWHIALKNLLFENKFEDKLKIILLDEPNNYLHIDAQNNLLSFFNKYTEENGNVYIFFTTHSPFFIDYKTDVLTKKSNGIWEMYNVSDFDSSSDFDEKNIRALTEKNNKIFDILEKNTADSKIKKLFEIDFGQEAFTRAASSLEEEINNFIIRNSENDVNIRKTIPERIIDIENILDKKNIDKFEKEFILKTISYVFKKRNSESLAHKTKTDLSNEEMVWISSLCSILNKWLLEN